MNLNNQEPLSTESQAALDESFAIKGDETYALKADAPEVKDTTPLQHGLQHLKSRLMIATTAWNSNFGIKRGVNILTTRFTTEAWPEIQDRVQEDVKTDAAGLNEIIWKPVAYLINQIVTSEQNYENKVFGAILTNGDYVYLRLNDNNFYLCNSGDETVVPATKIVMLRETWVTLPEHQATNLDDSEYVRAIAPNKVPRIRYTLKEEQEKHSLKRATEKRRKANKVAKKQKSKARK